MKLSPFPLSVILCFKVLFEVGYSLKPGSTHDFLSFSVSFEGKMNIIEDALLHVVESNQTHLLEMNRLGQVM